MIRREVITLLGGVAAWSLAARAQQSDTCGASACSTAWPRTIPRTGPHRSVLQALHQLGWTDGRNIQILRRFTDGDSDRARAYAAELVALAPDLILTSGASTTGVISAG